VSFIIENALYYEQKLLKINFVSKNILYGSCFNW